MNNIVVGLPGQTGIFCGNFDDTNPPALKFNNVVRLGGDAYGGACANVAGPNGNISADPLFADAAHGDYHPRAESPSIDAGDDNAPTLPAKDLKSFPGVLDGDANGTAVVDMGALRVLELRSAVQALE